VTDRYPATGLPPLRFDDLTGDFSASRDRTAILREGLARCRAHIDAVPSRRRSTARWLTGSTLVGAGILALTTAPLWIWAVSLFWWALLVPVMWWLQGYVRTIDDARPFETFLLPNGLTLLRLLLSPLVLWPGLLDLEAPMALRIAAPVGLALFDFLDGQIARRAHLESRFGRILDPAADLALMGFTASGLYVRDAIPLVPYLIIMVRYPGTVLNVLLVVRFVGAYDVISTKVGKVAGFLTSALLSLLSVEVIAKTRLFPESAHDPALWCLSVLLAGNVVYLAWVALSMRERHPSGPEGAPPP